MRVSGREGREEEGQSRAKRGMEETVRGKKKGMECDERKETYLKRKEERSLMKRACPDEVKKEGPMSRYLGIKIGLNIRETFIGRKLFTGVISIYRGYYDIAMFVLNAPRYAKEIRYHVKSEQGNGPREHVG